MTAKAHLARLHDLPCVVCVHMGMGWPNQVEVHHVESIRDSDSDYAGVPLCAEHHRGATGVHGLSRRGFADRYKLSDVDLLALTIKAMDKAGMIK